MAWVDETSSPLLPEDHRDRYSDIKGILKRLFLRSHCRHLSLAFFFLPGINSSKQLNHLKQERHQVLQHHWNLNAGFSVP